MRRVPVGEGCCSDEMRVVLAIIGFVLLAVGLAALVVPDLLAAGFGIPIDARTSRAYLLATGTRDVAMGCWLLALLRVGAEQRVLAVSILATALVAAGDAANVLTHSGGRGSIALAGHVGSLGVLLAVGVWLWRSRKV
jgi:hypothetical protein